MVFKNTKTHYFLYCYYKSVYYCSYSRRFVFEIPDFIKTLVKSFNKRGIHVNTVWYPIKACAAQTAVDDAGNRISLFKAEISPNYRGRGVIMLEFPQLDDTRPQFNDDKFEEEYKCKYESAVYHDDANDKMGFQIHDVKKKQEILLDLQKTIEEKDDGIWKITYTDRGLHKMQQLQEEQRQK